MDTSREPTEVELLQRDKDCEWFAMQMEKNHRPKIKRTSTKQPTFSIRLQPGQGELV